MSGAQAEDRAPFDCAICEREIDRRWSWRGRDREIPPICRYCEQEYARGARAPTHGAFRDRREAMRLIAVANALKWGALAQQWRESHASA